MVHTQFTIFTSYAWFGAETVHRQGAFLLVALPPKFPRPRSREPFFDERGGHAVHSGCNHRQRGESAAPAGAALAVGFAEHHPAAQRCRPSVARGGCTPSLLGGLCNNRHLRVALALPRLRGAPRPSRRAPRVPSHCRFRNRRTEYVSESGIKWTSGSSTKRQRD